MRFLVLGPLEVIADGGEPLRIAGSKERWILADLIAHAGRVVSVDELIGEIWGEQLPGSPEKTLWSYVSRLRRALLGHPYGSRRDVIATRGDGYVLELGSHEIEQVEGFPAELEGIDLRARRLGRSKPLHQAMMALALAVPLPPDACSGLCRKSPWEPGGV